MTRSATTGDDPSLVDRFRRPEYTGENRCLPCTVVNASIALGAGIALGAAAVAGGIDPFAATGLATAFLVLAGGSIYLRGYLVPYTPTLTKRYLPDRVLRWFDKTPDATPSGTDDEPLVDIERTLERLGVVTECEDADDLCLEPSFRREWHDRIGAMEDRTPGEEAVARLLDLDDPARVDVRRFGSAAVVRVDGRQAGQWESDAAFLADVAADGILRDRSDEWATIDVVNRSRVLNALRMFMERCPACGTPVTVDQEVVESCCRTMDVAAVSCDSCGSRVFEIELTEEMKAEAGL